MKGKASGKIKVSRTPIINGPKNKAKKAKTGNGPIQGTSVTGITKVK